MQENYDALKNLPIVLNLKKKNEKLKTENKNLKRLVSFLLTKCTLDTDSTEVTSCEQNECCPPKIIKKELFSDIKALFLLIKFEVAKYMAPLISYD